MPIDRRHRYPPLTPFLMAMEGNVRNISLQGLQVVLGQNQSIVSEIGGTYIHRRFFNLVMTGFPAVPAIV
jgi:hypothetical protein